MANTLSDVQNTNLVISSKQQQQGIRHDVHEGLRNDSNAKTKVSYRGWDIGKDFSDIKLKVTLNDLLRTAINSKNRGKL